MKLISLVFLSMSLVLACGETKPKNAPKDKKSQAQQEATIKSLLIGCQFKFADIHNSLPGNEAKLGTNFTAFSGSTQVFVRQRGVLLDDNKVVTSVNVHTGTGGTKVKNTYIALFDGTAKRLINSLFIGSYLSVLSVVVDESDNSVIKIDALVREAEQPASKIQSFTVKVQSNTIILL